MSFPVVLLLLSCLPFVLLLSTSFPSLKAPPSVNWLLSWLAFISLKGFHKLLGKAGNIQLPKCFPSVHATVLHCVDGESEGISLLSLPDLVLDSIFEGLSPAQLCVMSLVCSSLKEKCTSDYLWEKHLKLKWGAVLDEAAQKQWKKFVSLERTPKLLYCKEQRTKHRLLVDPGFFGWKSRPSRLERDSGSSSLGTSVISLYAALETGKLWFPAQVYEREVQNGYMGFALSCYDALLSYDSAIDRFIARYPSQGKSMIEDDVGWNRIRSPPVDTQPNDLHISDFLDELKPDDHIEIQWRKNEQFPYGWWYGIVGHLDTCSGNKLTCQCHMSDTVILEFKQYVLGSRWRRTNISRKDHREVGNEEDGFYGGIRKIYKKEEILKWQIFRPKCVMA